jgi:predicted AAA+ superfamily ATPase
LPAGGEFSYWRTPAGVEIDFIWTRGDSAVAIEVKSAARWQREFTSRLHRALEEGMVSQVYGVYLGSQIQRIGQV